MEQMSDLIVFLVVFSSTVLLFLLFFVSKLIFDAMKAHRDSRKQIVVEHLRPASRLSMHSNANSHSGSAINNNNNHRSLSSDCGDSLHSGSLKRKPSPTNSSSKSVSIDSAVWTTSSGSNSLNTRQQQQQQQQQHLQQNILQTNNNNPKILNRNSSNSYKNIKQHTHSVQNTPILQNKHNSLQRQTMIQNSQQNISSVQSPNHHILPNIETITDPLNREPYNTVQIVEQTNCKVHPFRITYCTKV